MSRAFTPLYTPDGEERRQREQIADAIVRRPLLDPAIRTTSFVAAVDAVYRVAGVGGSVPKVVLPVPSAVLFGKTVTVFLEGGAAEIWVAGVSSALGALSVVGLYEARCSIAGWRVHALLDGSVTTAILADGSVTNAKLANAPAYTVKGNPTASTAPPTDIALSDSASANSILGRLDGGLVSRLSRLGLWKLAIPRPRFRWIEEDFVGGSTTSGNIGRTGLNMFGVGTPTFARAGNATLLTQTRTTLSTSAASGDSAAIGWHMQAASGFLARNQVYLQQYILYLPTTYTSINVWAGLSDSAGNTLATMTDCMLLYATPATNTWHRYQRSGGVLQEDTDTGVAAVADGAYNLVIVNEPDGTFEAFIGGVSVGAFAGTLAANNLAPWMGVVTSTAGARVVHPHYMMLASRSVPGVYDDDNFVDSLVTRG